MESKQSKLAIGLIFGLFLQIIAPFAVADVGKLSCEAYFFFKKANFLKTPPFKQNHEITTLVYNPENFYYHVGKFERVDDFVFVPVPGLESEPKAPEKLAGIAEVFAEVSPHFFIGPEIEGKESLINFNRDYLASSYRPFLNLGNDGRGIDIGFYVRKDIKLDVEMRDYKDRIWTDPVTQRTAPIFSRDLPTLILREPGQESPAVILMGTHKKSKRDRKQDKESRRLRARQFLETLNIAKELKSEFGQDTLIILGGDLNTDLRVDPDARMLLEEFDDVFELAEKTIPEDQRVTHTYHPSSGSTVFSQLDGILISGSLSRIIEAGIYRYKDKSGRVIPLPNSYDQRSKNPSDHFPVWFTGVP